MIDFEHEFTQCSDSAYGTHSETPLGLFYFWVIDCDLETEKCRDT